VYTTDYKAVSECLLQPKVTLIGIGGGGGSTINNMIKRKLSRKFFSAITE
jgi:cell division GTPase FtsZ